MNVLLISTHDQLGGAAIAAYRLMEALNKSGVSANMLTINKQSANPHVTTVGNRLINKARFIAERGVIYIQNEFSKQHLFDISIANTGVSITQHPLFKAADIVHLHWINQGMLSLKEIGRIVVSGKKIIWTMHDMWPFTGICHHAASCNHFQNYCGSCPYLNMPVRKDLSYSTYMLKQAAYSLGNIHFVACSNWLKELALKSTLTQHHQVTAIANPLNTDVYKPTDKKALRKTMELPIDKKIILFAAAKVSDKRKGIDYLIEASKILAKKPNNDLVFLIVGNNSHKIIDQLALPVIDMSYVEPNDMPNIYNVADLFVTPSLQENLPNTIMESMACGTPCVGFNIGGIPEMIDHKQSGYVAKYKDASDLAMGLNWVANQLSDNEITEKARTKVVNNYNETTIAQKYIQLYNKA